MADSTGEESPLINREILVRLQRESDLLLKEAVAILQLQGIASSDPRRELLFVIKAVKHGVSEDDAKLFQGSRRNFAHFVDRLSEHRKSVTNGITVFPKDRQLTKEHIDRVFAAIGYGVENAQLNGFSPQGLAQLHTHVKTVVEWIVANLRDNTGRQLQFAEKDDVDGAVRSCLRESWEQTQKPSQRAYLAIECVALIAMATHGLAYQHDATLGAIFLTVGILINGLFIFLRRSLVM